MPSKYADQWDVDWESSVDDINLMDYYEGGTDSAEFMSMAELGEFASFDPTENPFFGEALYNHMRMMDLVSDNLGDFVTEDLEDLYQAETGNDVTSTKGQGIFGQQNMGYTDDFMDWADDFMRSKYGDIGLVIQWNQQRIWDASGNNSMGWGSAAMERRTWDQWGQYSFDIVGDFDEGEYNPGLLEFQLEDLSEEYNIDITQVEVDPGDELMLVNRWENDIGARGGILSQIEEKFDLTRGSVSELAKQRNIEETALRRTHRRSGLAGSGIQEQELDLFEDISGTAFAEKEFDIESSWGDIGRTLRGFSGFDIGMADEVLTGRKGTWEDYVEGVHFIGEEAAGGG